MKTLILFSIIISSILSMQMIAPEQTIFAIYADTTFKNPNGSSELALLMREMQTYSNIAKSDVKSGKKPAAYPISFDNIYTAKISENTSKNEFYKSFADLYIMTVKNYAISTPETRIDTYNNMVSACLACHSQHCPGPVPVIKKLMIE